MTLVIRACHLALVCAMIRQRYGRVPILVEAQHPRILVRWASGLVGGCDRPHVRAPRRAAILGGLLAVAVLLLASAAWAIGPLNPTTVSWTAPQTNTDGSNLNDLADYRIDLSVDGGTTWTQVTTTPAAEPDPISGRTQSLPITSLGITQDGQYHVTLRACDTAGNCSARAAPSAPFVVNRVAPSAPGAPAVQ